MNDWGRALWVRDTLARVNAGLRAMRDAKALPRDPAQARKANDTRARNRAALKGMDAEWERLAREAAMRRRDADRRFARELSRRLKQVNPEVFG